MPCKTYHWTLDDEKRMRALAKSGDLQPTKYGNRSGNYWVFVYIDMLLSVSSMMDVFQTLGIPWGKMMINSIKCLFPNIFRAYRVLGWVFPDVENVARN